MLFAVGPATLGTISVYVMLTFLFFCAGDYCTRLDVVPGFGGPESPVHFDGVAPTPAKNDGRVKA